MKQYLDYIEDILDNGEKKSNRTGVDTYGVFGRSLDFDLQQGFPAVTSKKLAWKSVCTELVWFLSGSPDERFLASLQHGFLPATALADDRDTIWKANVDNFEGDFVGDAGRIYGVQWREWEHVDIQNTDIMDNGQVVADGFLTSHDQIGDIIQKLRTNPDDRRIILNSWNVGEVNNGKMALPPCHVMAQFHVNSEFQLSCHMYQRSVDSFLGLPFNIASYALLTHILAGMCNLDVGRLIWSGGDCHIYENHIAQCEEMVKREPYPLPRLEFNGCVDHNWDEFQTIDDFLDVVREQMFKGVNPFHLFDYKSHPALTGEMAV